MKRIIALLMGLAMLAGCGAGGIEIPETVSLPISIQPTIPNASDDTSYDDCTAVPAPTDSEGNVRFQLYAELPEEDIYLYEVMRNQGMVLFQGNSANHFSDWEAARRFNDLVDIVYYDFDGDGEREIAVTTGIRAGGSGPALDNLHILKVHEETPYPNPEYKTIRYTEYALTYDDVAEYFKEAMTWKHGKEANTIELRIDGKKFLTRRDPDIVWDEEKGVEVSRRIYFEFDEDGGIKLSAVAFSWNAVSEHPHGIGAFAADVVFNGKEFHLINLEFRSIGGN